MKVRWTETAVSEVDRIFSYITNITDRLPLPL
jgi:plasmid stabilization system protein ParE